MIQENSSQCGDLLICDLNLAYDIIILSFLDIIVPYFHIGGRYGQIHDHVSMCMCKHGQRHGRVVSQGVFEAVIMSRRVHWQKYDHIARYVEIGCFVHN